MDRERMLDMEKRLKPLRAASMGVLALGLVVSGPWLGFWTLPPLAAAFVAFAVADRFLERVTRPEYLLFAAWAASELIIAAAVAMTGGPNVATFSWLAIPVVTLSARFSLRAMLAGVALALTLLAAVAFGVDAGAVAESPPLVIAPMALIISLSILSVALMQFDRQHRTEAVIDPLTGMLNRTALDNRVNELVQQSRLTGEPVGLLVCDIDHFKRVNDMHGHAAGDAVLTDVAYTLRKHLRAFDSAYRVGGEEFLVLLPGADTAHSLAVAEGLRRAIEETPAGDGLTVTMSFGVSVSPRESAFDESVAFAEADAALYRAKRNGRNRVCLAEARGATVAA
jgi:diguanylate cyclase (GGDEF)-like protein